MFFWNSCFFHDPVDVGNLISGSSALSKTSLNLWKFKVHVLLKLGLENFTEAPILWPPDVKSWLTGKDPVTRKDWGQEKRVTEDEMAGWHHWLDGQKFEWTPGVGDGQGGLVCCSPWSHKELDMTEWLNDTMRQLVILVTSSTSTGCFYLLIKCILSKILKQQNWYYG